MLIQEAIEELRSAPRCSMAERAAVPGKGFYLSLLDKANGEPVYNVCTVSRYPLRSNPGVKHQRRFPAVAYRFTDYELLATDWQIVGEYDSIKEKYYYGDEV